MRLPKPGGWSQGATEEEALANIADAVRALEKVGFWIIRQGKHIVMSEGIRKVTLPRHNPVNALTMGGIVGDAGFSIEEFRTLL